MFHNYSGPAQVGAEIFDLLEVLQNFDPRFVSFHYDTGHATEGGGNGTWALGLHAIGPYLGGMSFKDVILADRPQAGRGGARAPSVAPAPESAGRPAGRGSRGGDQITNPWHAVAVPLGTGMIDLPLIAAIMKQNDFQGPVKIQAEYVRRGDPKYDMGGADQGQDQISVPRDRVLGAMQADLAALKVALGSAGFL